MQARFKRFTALILSVLMVLTCMPMSAMAEDAVIPAEDISVEVIPEDADFVPVLAKSIEEVLADQDGVAALPPDEDADGAARHADAPTATAAGHACSIDAAAALKVCTRIECLLVVDTTLTLRLPSSRLLSVTGRFPRLTALSILAGIPALDGLVKLAM